MGKFEMANFTFVASMCAVVLSLAPLPVFCVVLVIWGFIDRLMLRDRDPLQRATSYALGLIIGLTVYISNYAQWTAVDSPIVHRFCDYIIILCFFHWSEYAAIAFVDESKANFDSFMINHSWAYCIAAVGSWIEFSLEGLVFGEASVDTTVSRIGIMMCLTGELIRKTAILTANRDFTHQVRSRKVQGHQLVTHGIYSVCRHPSYVGWMLWSMGTQVVLCNPLSLIAYTVASWRFFDERIEDEEFFLRQFFGGDYEKYQRNVHSGIPFVRGCTKGRME